MTVIGHTNDRRLDYLYSFGNSESCLVEIKKLEVNENSKKSDAYKWIYVPNRNGLPVELEFISMNSSNDKEERKFSNANLSFSKELANFSFFNEIHKFKFIEKPNREIKEYVNKYLKTSSFFEALDRPQNLYRLLKPSDLSCFKEWLKEEEVIRYSLTEFHKLNKTEDVVRWFSKMLTSDRSISIGLTNKGGQLIGYAGLSSVNSIDKNAEYFILIGDRSYWNKGIAKVVTKDIVEYGFKYLGLHRIFLTASSENLGALKAYKSAGFKKEGIMKEAFFRDGTFSNKIIMGLLSQDWKDGASGGT